MNTIITKPANEVEVKRVESVQELDDSQLALVGGGIGDAVFG
jgi:hypothetical protein